MTVSKLATPIPGGEEFHSVLSVQSVRTDEAYVRFEIDGTIKSIELRDIDADGVLDGLLLVESKEQSMIVRLELSPPHAPIVGETEPRAVLVAGPDGRSRRVVALDDEVIGGYDQRAGSACWVAIVPGFHRDDRLSPAITVSKSSSIVIAHTPTGLAGIAADTGRILWRHESKIGAISTGDVVVIPREDWMFTVLDAATGRASFINWKDVREAYPKAEISTTRESFANVQCDGIKLFLAVVTIQGTGSAPPADTDRKKGPPARNSTETDLVAWNLRTGDLAWRVALLREPYHEADRPLIPSRSGGLRELRWEADSSGGSA